MGKLRPRKADRDAPWHVGMRKLALAWRPPARGRRRLAGGTLARQQVQVSSWFARVLGRDRGGAPAPSMGPTHRKFGALRDGQHRRQRTVVTGRRRRQRAPAPHARGTLRTVGHAATGAGHRITRLPCLSTCLGPRPQAELGGRRPARRRGVLGIAGAFGQALQELAEPTRFQVGHGPTRSNVTPFPLHPGLKEPGGVGRGKLHGGQVTRVSRTSCSCRPSGPTARRHPWPNSERCRPVSAPWWSAPPGGRGLCSPWWSQSMWNSSTSRW